MGFIVAVCAGLIVWRLPLLRAEGKIESVYYAREAAFVINNWALLGIMTFIAVATVFPKISELWAEPVTVGPPFYNRWIVPAGLVVFALMGAGPLFAWRKTSPAALRKAFVIPLAVLVGTAVIHLAIGARFGFPGIVASETIYPGVLGVVLRKSAPRCRSSRPASARSTSRSSSRSSRRASPVAAGRTPTRACSRPWCGWSPRRAVATAATSSTPASC